MQTICVTAALH